MTERNYFAGSEWCAAARALWKDSSRCCWLVGELALRRKRRLSSPASLVSGRGVPSVVQRTLFFLNPTARCLCFAATSVVLRWLKSMPRSIELGRAVLSTSTANFELWLRTLITITPQQQCTNVEQRDATSILGLLSSGKVWVGRGNGLYIDLDLTSRGQPLADEQLQQLSEAILEAPVSTDNASKLSVAYKVIIGLGTAEFEAVVALRCCP